jgi:hypothetical protein
MPEFMDENLEAKHVGGEIHPGETTEEKIARLKAIAEAAKRASGKA